MAGDEGAIGELDDVVGAALVEDQVAVAPGDEGPAGEEAVAAFGFADF
jgi:hypothetical protein